MKRVVNFSGGIASWMAARRVAEAHGTTDLVLLFADTRSEDEDLYRFVREAAADVGGELVWLDQGRDIWEVFRAERFLGNTRVDPCSRILKREPCDRWVEAHCDPSATIRYLGYDWTELHRLERTRRAQPAWRWEAPLCEKPYLTKEDMIRAAETRGLAPPRLYALGFRHNNCGGACVKGGLAQWTHLLHVFPERYAQAEVEEELLRAMLGKNVAILRDRSGGGLKPLTLRALRERVTARPEQATFWADDWGGCGCFADEAAP